MYTVYTLYDVHNYILSSSCVNKSYPFLIYPRFISLYNTALQSSGFVYVGVCLFLFLLYVYSLKYTESKKETRESNSLYGSTYFWPVSADSNSDILLEEKATSIGIWSMQHLFTTQPSLSSFTRLSSCWLSNLCLKEPSFHMINPCFC